MDAKSGASQAGIPKQDAGIVHYLDPNSATLYRNSILRHQSGKKLQAAIIRAGKLMLNDGDACIQHMNDRLSHEQMLRTHVADDENILGNGETLMFDARYVKNVGVNRVPGALLLQYPGGQLILTDKRVLFLSSMNINRMSFAQEGVLKDPKTNFGRYLLERKVEDNVSIAFYDISWFKTVQFEAASGFSSQFDVKPLQEICCGYRFCFPKTWRTSAISRCPYNTRKLVFGIMNPIHGHETIEVAVSAQVRLNVVNEFLVNLQRMMHNKKLGTEPKSHAMEKDGSDSNKLIPENLGEVRKNLHLPS